MKLRRYLNINPIKNIVYKGEKPIIEIKSANRKIKCTNNHPFLTLNGWKSAKDLTVGEELLTSEPTTLQSLNALNDDQYQIMLGSFLGDGHVSNHGLSRYRIKFIHCEEQEDYCQWKANTFNCDTRTVEKNGYAERKAITFNTKMFGLNKLLPCSGSLNKKYSSMGFR